MMHEREKSDPAVVAVKPVNAAERSVTESVEKGRGRGECEPAQHGPSTETGNRVTGVGAHTASSKDTLRRHSPKVGAVCGKAARTVLCGGRSAMSVPCTLRVA
jgi:hypothetical protein